MYLEREELQERTSIWKTTCKVFKTACKALGVLAIAGGTFIAAKSVVGSRGNSGNSDNPGNAVGTFEPVLPRTADPTSECVNLGGTYVPNSYGTCKFNEIDQKIQGAYINLYNQSSRIDGLNGDLYETKKIVATANESIAAHNIDIKELKKGNAESEAKIGNLTVNVSGIETKLATAENSIAVHGADIDGLKLNSTESAVKIAELVKKGEKLQTDVDSLTKKVEKLNTSVESLKREKAALEVENTKLKGLIDNLQSNSTEIKETIEALKAKDTKLKAEINTLSNTTSQTQERVDAFKERLDTVENSLFNLTTEVAVNRNVTDALKSNNTDLSEKIAFVKKELDSNREEIAKLNTTVDTGIAEAKKAFKDEINATQADFQDQFYELNKTVTGISQATQATDKKIDAARADLQDQFYKLNKTVTESISPIIEDIPELKKLIEDYQQGNFTFTEMSEKIGNLTEEFPELKKELKALKEKVSKLPDAVNMLASALVGENVTVIGENVDVVDENRSQPIGTVFPSLEANQKGTLNRTYISEKGMKRVSTKISIMNNRTKQAIEAASVACGIGAFAVLVISGGMFIRKQVVDGRQGCLTELFPNFFGKKYDKDIVLERGGRVNSHYSSSENESELAASEVGGSGFEAENSNSLETNISVRVKEAHKAKKSSPSSREH